MKDNELQKNKDGRTAKVFAEKVEVISDIKIAIKEK